MTIISRWLVNFRPHSNSLKSASSKKTSLAALLHPIKLKKLRPCSKNIVNSISFWITTKSVIKPLLIWQYAKTIAVPSKFEGRCCEIILYSVSDIPIGSIKHPCLLIEMYQQTSERYRSWHLGLNQTCSRNRYKVRPNQESGCSYRKKNF